MSGHRITPIGPTRKAIARVCGAALPLHLLWLAACSNDGRGDASAPAASARVDPTVSADAWPGFGGDGHERHYASAAEIAVGNVGRLGLAWHQELEAGFSVSAPVEAGGRLFVTTGHSHIRALDAATGKPLWEYDARTREIAKSVLQLGWGNKGLAYWNGKVVIATSDGRVIALDAATGKVAWEQREYGLDEPRYTLGAPRVFAGKVIVGHGGADISAIRGYVTAYDVETGKRLWRFYTAPGDPSKPATTRAEQLMRASWKGDWFGKGGGGTAWNAFSYDPELNLLYIGTGNGYPYAQSLRSPGGGDNLFLASIVAVDADSGDYRWHYQVCPAEQWDCTATMDMSLIDAPIDGKPRKLLVQAPKNGFVYVLDRTNGHFISAEKFAKVTWADRIDPKTGRPVENPGIRYTRTGKMFDLWPGPQGAHSWLPQAYSPKTGLVYIPVEDLAAKVGPAKPGMGPFGSLGATMLIDLDVPGSRRSYLKAWDPIRQKQAWVKELPGDFPAGVLATAGGLVFQGTIDGQLIAYDATSGKPVWSFRAQAPIVAPPISYRLHGRQYVTVLTGSGSQGGGLFASGNAAYNTDYRLPRHILTFAIDGRDALPAFTPPPQDPPSDPGFRPDARAIAAGMMTYASNGCLVCHGSDAIGGGAAPDLRWSSVIVDRDAFRAILHDGALKLSGMPAFPQISDADIEAIRYYVRSRARQLPADRAALKGGSARSVKPYVPVAGKTPTGGVAPTK